MAIRSALLVTALALLEAGCSAPILVPSAGAFSLANQIQGKRLCYIRHQNTPAYTVYIKPDGSTEMLTAEECTQKNQEAQLAEQQAQQKRIADADQEAQEEDRKRNAILVQNIKNEMARGYKPTTLKDLYLDGKDDAARGTKVSVHGFYKSYGRHKERLYNSYAELMNALYQPGIETLSIGLLTDDGSRAMREYLLRCAGGAGCDITILGHVEGCTETNLLGAATDDVCLVAEDMRPAPRYGN